MYYDVTSSRTRTNTHTHTHTNTHTHTHTYTHKHTHTHTNTQTHTHTHRNVNITKNVGRFVLLLLYSNRRVSAENFFQVGCPFLGGATMLPMEGRDDISAPPVYLVEGHSPLLPPMFLRP